MKTRIKQGISHPVISQNNQPIFNRFRSLIKFNKQLPALTPSNARVNVSEQTMLEQKLAELELERKQAAALSYAGMLPPR